MDKILRDKKAILLFLLPALIVYLFTVFMPIIESLYYSFFSWDGIFDRDFIGLENYIKMLTGDPVFWQAFTNNLIYVAINVLMQVFLGLAVAILLTYITKGRELIKTIYFTPAIITTVAITHLFRNIYSFEPVGLINYFLKVIGLGHLTQAWLSNLDTSLIAVSIPEGWRFLGLYMIILYSALISIPNSVEEAAKLDGATGWSLFKYIRLPMIQPVLILTLIMCITGTLRGFDIPFLLTNGGPGHATELITTYMYKKAFTSMQYGYGSTIAVFIVFESLLAVFMIRKYLDKE